MIEETNYRVTSTAHTRGILGDCIENGLEVTGRAADHPKDLGRGRLLLLRLRLVPQGLRQPLLQVADPRSVILGRLATNRELSFLGLRRLWTPAH
jgi:hypothetical protein